MSDENQSRRNVLKKIGATTFVGYLSTPQIPAQSSRITTEANRELRDIINKHGGISSRHVRFYKDGSLWAEVGSSNVKREPRKGLDNYVGSVQNLAFEDGSHETIITSVKDSGDGYEVSVEFVELNKDYSYTLNRNDINKRRALTEETIHKAKESFKQSKKSQQEVTSSSTTTVVLGKDKQITNNASAGSEDEKGFGAPAGALAVPSAQTPECQAYAFSSGSPVSNPTAIAEVWQNVEVVGHYPAKVQINVSGFWRAAITDVAAGAGLQVEVFIRESGTGETIDRRYAKNKTSDIVEFWEDQETFWESLSWATNLGRLEQGTYEIGLRLTASANNLGAETAITDVHREKLPLKHGYANMSVIKVDFSEEVNPFFDGPDLQNPKARFEVTGLIDSWNETGQIDGIEYSQSEVGNMVTQWNNNSNDNKILFYRPLPGFKSDGLPPNNTYELDNELYEDINGNGDGLDVTQSVKWYGEFIRNPDSHDYLTDEQVAALDWDDDGELTSEDAVSLFGEQIRTDSSINMKINGKSINRASNRELRKLLEKLLSKEVTLDDIKNTGSETSLEDLTSSD